MKKNNYKKTRKPNYKPLIIFIFLLIILAIFFKTGAKFLRQSGLFRIKKITYPKIVALPPSSDIFDLLGENLFSINVIDVSGKFKERFPQLSKVRLLKRLPDELIIDAQVRIPIALVKLSEKYFYVDSEGAIISSANSAPVSLPIILGVIHRPANLVIGQIYDDKCLKFGLEIIREIDRIAYLRNLALTKVNVANLNHASFIFRNGIEVIIGEEGVKDRLQLLVVLVSRLAKELDQVKYIDLRFKEPVIARK